MIVLLKLKKKAERGQEKIIVSFFPMRMAFIILILAVSAKKNLAFSQENDSIEIVKDISFKWQFEWTPAEKMRVEKLLYSLGYNAQKTLGKLPFPLKFFCRQSEMSQPLGGCVAKFKGLQQGVHLGMDLDYSDQQFRESWKIHHEISHLHLPKLGPKAKWFYEGFATFMSRQIMRDMGLFTESSLDKLQRERFDEIREDFEREGTFLEVIAHHQENWNFSAYYWGGCSYFYRANRALVNKYDTNLCEIVKEYQKGEREDDMQLKDVLHSWDNILGHKLFTTLMRKYRTQSASKVIGDV